MNLESHFFISQGKHPTWFPKIPTRQLVKFWCTREISSFCWEVWKLSLWSVRSARRLPLPWRRDVSRLAHDANWWSANGWEMYANDVMPDLVDSKTITLKTIRHICICLKVGGCLKIATLMGIGMTNRLIMKFLRYQTRYHVFRQTQTVSTLDILDSCARPTSWFALRIRNEASICIEMFTTVDVEVCWNMLNFGCDLSHGNHRKSLLRVPSDQLAKLFDRDEHQKGAFRS